MAGNYNLGTARGVIEIDYDGKGVKQALGGLDSVEKKSSVSGKVAKGALIGLAGAGVAIAAGFALAVHSAADFQKKISDIKAVSGGTTQQIEAIRQKSLQLGKDTQFSASQAADAISELVKAGVSLPDVLNGAADATVNLAAAGGVDLPQAATIASNAMNQFSLAAKDLPKVADAIAGAANASAIDVSQFGLSLSQVGAVAHLAGLSFQDTAVAIAEMGNAGIKGSDAGTSLKTFLQNLIPTTKTQITLSKQLGLITKDGGNAFFDATGKAKGLAGISQVLQNALKGQTKEQKLATLGTLFGSDAIRAAAVLAENGAAGYDKLNAAIGKVKAADVAKTKMDNLSGSVEQLKGSAETLAIVVGSALLPGLKKAADGANGFLGVLIDKLPGAIAAIPQLIKTVVDLGKQFFAFLQSIGVVDSAIRLASGAFQTITAVASVLWQIFQQLEPTLVIIAAVVGGALVVAFAAASFAMEGIGKAAQFVADNLVAIEIAVGVLAAILAPILIANAGLFVALQIAAARSAAGQIRAFVTTAAAAVKNAAIMYVNCLKMVAGWVASAAGAVASAATQVAAWITIAARAVIGAAISVVQFGIMIAGWAASAVAATASALVMAAAWLIALGPIGLVIAGVIALAVVIALNFDRIKGYVVAAFNFIKAFVIRWWPIFLAVLLPFLALPILIWKYFSQIKGFVSAAWNAALAVTKAIVNTIITFISGIPSRITGALGNLGGLLVGAGSALIGGFSNGIHSAWNNILNFFIFLYQEIAGAVGDLGGVLYDVGASIINGLWDGMKSVWSTVGGWLSSLNPASLFNDINPYKHHAEKNLVPVGEKVFQGLLSGMMAGWADAATWLSSIDPSLLISPSTSQSINMVGRTAAINSSINPSSLAGFGSSTISNNNSSKVEKQYNIQVSNAPDQPTESIIAESLRRTDVLYAGVDIYG